MSKRGIVLDAGAFFALERRNAEMAVILREVHKHAIPLVTSAGVVAQVWRGGAGKQMPVSVLLAMTEVVDLTRARAKAIGMLLGATKARDPIDAHLVFIAKERGWAVLTSDPDDLRAMDATLPIETI